MVHFNRSSWIFLLVGIVLLCETSCTDGQVREFNAELFYQDETETGRSILWHPDRQSLFWVDTDQNKLCEYILAEKTFNSWLFDSKVGCVIPETDEVVVLALEKKIIRHNLNDLFEETIALIDYNNKTVRCNDGKASPDGRLWVETVSHDLRKGAGTAYCVYPNGHVDKMLKGLTASNGFVWSGDKQFMYHNDLPNRLVKRYRYDSRSEDIIYSGVSVKIPKETGIPEGITIDRHDNLWIPQKGGFGVYCYNPYTSQLLAKVNVPSPNVTSCVFGGKDMDTLYIITSRKGLTEQQLKIYPLSGSIFACKIAPVGVKPFYFGKKNYTD